MTMLIERYFRQRLAALPPSLRHNLSDSTTLRRLADLDCLVATSSSFFYSGEVVLNQCFTIQDQKDSTRAEVLAVAGSLAGRSRQPIMRALRFAAEQAGGVREMETDTIPGGLLGVLERRSYVLGAAAAMEEEGITLGVASSTLAQQLLADGLTPLFLAQKNPKRLLGVFAMLRKTSFEARTAVSALAGLSVSTVLCTAQSVAGFRDVGPSLIIRRTADAAAKKELYTTIQKECRSALFLVDTTTFRQVPEGVLTARIGNPTAAITLNGLEQLPELVTASRSVLEGARQRFFWYRPS